MRELDFRRRYGKNSYMSKRTKSMSELLRIAITNAKSLRSVELETGIKRQSLATFLRGESTLRLDAADKLAAYFGISVTVDQRKGGR